MSATANRVQPWLDDGDVQLYHGDAEAVLKGLPAGIAQTCVTSPPYFGLRDYGIPEQIGLEDNVADYVDRLVCVFNDVRRVLRDDGTLWVNLGDSFFGGGYANHRINGETWLDEHGGDRRQSRQQDRINANPGLKPKDLVGIPWRVAFALQTDGWYLRSDIIWSKPNPMPESVTDRPTKAHEYVFLFSKQPRYFFDSDAIREPLDRPELLNEKRQMGTPTKGSHSLQQHNHIVRENRYANPAGRNRRSVWTIATEPFAEAHFATYPQELVRPCIQAGTSERGECVECGAPWRRLAETSIDESRPAARRNIIAPQVTQHGQGTNANGLKTWGHWTKRETTGWEPSCSCDAPTRPQTCIDPFIGSGTTALVARKHGRRCIGIDLSAQYLAIAARRTQQLSLLGGVA